MEAPLQVTIWQDPTEAKHKLSTTPLLNMSVPNSRIVVADSFSFDELFPGISLRECLLLFPLENKKSALASQREEFKHLLILDGTWRKVRRLFHLNSWLSELPHITLNPRERSNYRIRKSPREDGLSTIEAGVEAFSWLDPERDYRPILGVLDKMVRYQEEKIPPQHRKTNQSINEK